MEALKQDNVDTVRRFLSGGMRMGDFFVTVKQLEDLYNSVSAPIWMIYIYICIV